MQPIPEASAVPLETLLTHAEWVRGLARRLVADPSSAEDLEQEVWRTALENPPRDSSNPRGWLASVARNAARSLGRSSTRRELRERDSAKPEALPSTSELVAEAELARELAGEVLALEEPYRTVLLLRFWRALGPDEIASAQSIPRETVRTQLKRGLERLRERLDRRYGEREKWLAALAPLARDVRIALGGGVLVFALKFGAAAALAAGVWWAWPASAPQADEIAGAAPVPGAETASLDAVPPPVGARAPVPDAGTAGSVASSKGAAVGEHSSTRGRVVDLAGQPLGGIELEWRSESQRDWPHWEGETLHLRHQAIEVPARILELLRSHPEEVDRMIAEIGDEPGFREAVLGEEPPRWISKTGSDGRFEIELGEGVWTPGPTDPRLMVVARSSPNDGSGVDLLVAPCVRIAGKVVDEDDQPIAGAGISASIDLKRLDGFADTTIDTFQWLMLGSSAVDGTFSIERVPAGPEFKLDVQRSGLARSLVEAPSRDELDLRVVLRPLPKDERPRLSGLVVDPRGTPVQGVAVSLGQDQDWTDEQGRFEISLSIGHAGESLTAVKLGYQSVVLPSFGESPEKPRSDVLLRLGPPALSIEGHVRLPDGSSPGRCHVQLCDGTPFGSSDSTLEDHAAGHSRRGLETDADGHFVLEGLCARDYRLLAWSTQHGQIAYTDPIAAGSKGVVVQDRPEDFLPRLAGRVVTRQRVPLEGVEVWQSVCVHQNLVSWTAQVLGKVRTDAQGRFELVNVPREWCKVGLGGPSVKQARHEVPADPGAELELVATLEVRTRLDIADGTIDEVRFFDATGARVAPIVEFPDRYSQQFSVEREEGAFPTFSITDDAVTAVLLRGKAEVRRAPVEIRREKLLVLRL